MKIDSFDIICFFQLCHHINLWDARAHKTWKYVLVYYVIVHYDTVFFTLNKATTTIAQEYEESTSAFWNVSFGGTSTCRYDT